MTESNSGRKNQSDKRDAVVLTCVLPSIVIATFVMAWPIFLLKPTSTLKNFDMIPLK